VWVWGNLKVTTLPINNASAVNNAGAINGIPTNVWYVVVPIRPDILIAAAMIPKLVHLQRYTINDIFQKEIRKKVSRKSNFYILSLMSIFLTVNAWENFRLSLMSAMSNHRRKVLWSHLRKLKLPSYFCELISNTRQQKTKKRATDLKYKKDAFFKSESYTENLLIQAYYFHRLTNKFWPLKNGKCQTR